MINGDFEQRTVVHTGEMAWQQSPSPSVIRKRLFHAGPAEAGRVTSIVRYLPGASFHAHDHPEGEEILVLEGTFSDHTGDWPAPAWLLNPEGFRHAPGSAPGCLLFVRLRQYTGTRQVAVPLHLDTPGEQVLDTWQGTTTRTVNLAAGEELDVGGDGGAEGLVLAGTLGLWEYKLATHDWFRVPPGETARLVSNGCIVYLHEHGVATLAQSIPAMTG